MSLDNVTFDFNQPSKEWRAAPNGRYLMHIVEEKLGTDAKGQPFLDVTFGFDSALDGQDLTNVDLSRLKAYDKIYLTEKAKPVAVDKFFRKVLPDLEGRSGVNMQELRQELVNRPVIGHISVSTTDRAGVARKYPRYEIVRYESVS